MRISGTIDLPGDKSISHRALMFASIANGESIIKNLSTGEDVVSTMKCLIACGAKIVKNNEVVEIPAIDVDKVVDTTGAGDLFASGFLYGLCQNKDLARCGHMASVAAAEIISHYGARPLSKLSNLV